MLNSAFDFTPAVIYLPVLEQLAMVQFSKEAVLLRQTDDAETDKKGNKTFVFYVLYMLKQTGSHHMLSH